MSQLVVLVIINIAFGFASGGSIDNAAHLGGLAAGLFIGALVPPTAVPTLSSLWQRPVEQGVGAATTTAPGYLAVVAVAVVGVVVAGGIALGTAQREASPDPNQLGSRASLEVREVRQIRAVGASQAGASMAGASLSAADVPLAATAASTE
jgi:hypothetical protein